MEKVKDWNYKVVEKIGQGVFGEVCKCLNRETGQKVAIKMIAIQNEADGVPSYLIAGVSLLKELEHDNIVRLLDVLNGDRYWYLVFEYLDLDLGSLIRKHTITSIRPLVKTILSQILVGLAYYHSHNILHGDLQPSNVLIDLKSKKVKLADFGLTTSFGVPHIEYSYNEVESPYKAPESRICSSVYSTPHDVWAVGCIFAEMVSGKPLFPCGKKDHLSLIVRLLDLAEKSHGLEPSGVELLSQMLCLDPDHRVTANDALLHRYLRVLEYLQYEYRRAIAKTRGSLVYKCRHYETDRIVAIKNINFKYLSEGVPSSVIREVALLKKLEHKYIVRLLDVQSDVKSANLVFEYVNITFYNVIQHYHPIDLRLIKKFLYCILSGISYCHAHKILHRDLTPMNLLVDTKNKIVKIADFGMAMEVDAPFDAHTTEVLTLYYRAPEFLLGRTNYSAAIDMWAVGCIFAEIYFGMPGADTLPEVTLISDHYWRMLSLNPTTRITAESALNHPYFKGKGTRTSPLSSPEQTNMKKVKDCCYKVVKKTNGSEQMEKVKDWNYKVVEKIGQGVFGEVYKCLNLETGKKVAIKMINIQNEPEGVPSYLISGVSLLKELEHDNIVRLLDVLTSGRYVYLVFEYLDLDLGSFIRKHTATSIRPHIKTILSQILVGLAYYHSHNILHGDLQPSNVLIDLKSKKVKLADFGLTTSFGVPHIEYSYNEVGSPYKAPESRIRSSVYSTPHDVWAVGCIFAEMVSGNPLFPCGKKDHLSLIVRYLEDMINNLFICYWQDLAEQLLGLGLEPPGVELLSQMLYLDPDLRVTANGALLHRYLRHAEDIRIAETVPLKLPSSNKPSFSQKCRHYETDRIVAIKNINFKAPSEAVPSSVIREVGLLTKLEHKYIVSINLVFEHVDDTLHNIIQRCYPIDLRWIKLLLNCCTNCIQFTQCSYFGMPDADTLPEVALLSDHSWRKPSDELNLAEELTRLEPDGLDLLFKFLYCILSGISYCHPRKIIHRDLTTMNLLADIENKTVKIAADSGMAKKIDAPFDAHTTE
ncbi:hypothetical protein CUMW_122280, partial [Citrus unshiu]